MKLLIASDIHGSAQWAATLRDIFEATLPDRLVLLGDLLYHGPRNDLPDKYNPKEVSSILNEMAEYIFTIKGNCDADVDQVMLKFPASSPDGLLFVEGATLFATHGHIHGPQNMPPLSPGNFLLCGHTHIGAEKAMGPFIYLNPGSIALPRDGHHSYMLYEDGIFTRCSTTGEELGRWVVKQ